MQRSPRLAARRKKTTSSPGAKLIAKLAEFSLPGWLVKFLLLGLLLLVGLAIKPLYQAVALPVFAWQMELLMPKFEVKDMSFSKSLKRRESRIQVKIHTSEQLGYTKQVVPRGTDMHASTLYGHALQSFWIFFGLIILLARLPWQQLMTGMVAAIPIWLLSQMLDTPMVLLGALEELLLSNMAPEQLKGNIWVLWMNIMNTGGRIAVTVFAALLSLALIKRLRFA